MGVQLSGGEQPNRNDPCPCKSGLKFKYCHGDPVKRMICTRIANEHMANLIRQEQKKCGLVPYNFTCNGCGHGFDKPNIGLVAPKLPMCPKCNSTDIERNEDESVGG